MKKDEGKRKNRLHIFLSRTIIPHMKNLFRFFRSTRNIRRNSRIANLGESMAAFNAPFALPSAGWHPAPRRDTAMPQDVR